MNYLPSKRIKRIFGKNYKWISSLTTILILGLALYFLLPQIFLAARQPEETASSLISNEGILFQDNFTDPKSGWPSANRPDGSFGYQDPTFYFLELTAPDNNLTVFQNLNLVDFTAETKLSVNYSDTLSGDFRAGLAFRRSGDNFYAFTVSPNTRTWQVLKYTAGDVEVLAKGRHSTIHDAVQVFSLRVVARERTFAFYINNEFAVEVADADYRSGNVGFVLETLDETGARIIFDSLAIEEIEGQTVAAVPNLTPAASAIVTAATATAALTPTLIPDALPPATSLPPTSTVSPTLPATPAPPTRIPSSIPPTPTPDSSLGDTLTLPAPTSSPLPTVLPLLPTLPPTPTLTSSPPPTATSVPPTPDANPTTAATSTPASIVPTGTFVLLKPLDLEQPSFGSTDFEWTWTGPVPPGYGFEVRVWREGEAVAGVHNAVLDNQNGNVKSIGQNKYTLNTNIKDAAGIKGRKGEYLWTVALVQTSPAYADLGQQAAPARLRFETPGGNDNDNGGSNGSRAVGVD
jgi:hypothetical protein